MKKLLLVFLLFTKLTDSQSQIIYEHTFVRSLSGAIGQEFFLTNIGYDNYKYVLYDYDSSKFNLYNLDYTPFMLDIHVPVTSDLASNVFYRLGYITLDLFDCDSTNIEFAMMLNTPRPNAHPNFGIFRTDGTVLFTKDTVGTVFCIGCGSGSYEMHAIMNTSDGPKLYLFNNDSVPNENIFVYDLCGTLPTQIYEKQNDNNYVKIFPNPSNRELVFELTNLDHFEKYELTILNSLLKVVKVIEVKEFQERLILNCEQFASGTYFFSFKNARSVLQNGKFIVSK